MTFKGVGGGGVCGWGEGGRTLVNRGDGKGAVKAKPGLGMDREITRQRELKRPGVD